MIKSVLQKLPKLIFNKRFLFLMCLLTVIFTGIAQAGTFNGQSFQEALGKPGISKEKFDAQSMTDLVHGGNCMLTGCNEISGDFKKGALGATGDMVAMLYTPSVSGTAYVASVIKNFGIAKPAYAQTGNGFTQLNAILPVWRAFRDFTYVFFVLILIVTGFGIMFRWKLNPQTVITIQSAIPRIVIALILVTFSYAIAGLVIDFMYVLIAIPAMLLGPFWNDVGGTTRLQEQFLRGSLFDLVGALWGQVGQDNVIRVGSATGGVAGGIGLIIASVGGPIGGIIGALVGFSAGALIGIALIALILSIIVLIQLFRLFFALLQNYVAIILLIILGPIQIALGVIPGMPGFDRWIRSLIANMLGFVGVAVVLMLGMVISQSISTNGLWEPPFLPGFVAGTMNGIIGLGILLTIHRVPQLIRESLGIRGLGLNPQEGFRPLTGNVAGAIETHVNVWERANQGQTARALRFASGILRGIGGR